MVFGHNPFVWTPVQVIKNAETASGTMVFNGMFDWIPGVGDDDEEDENGGTGIDFIDDIVDTITEWTSKITETFNVGLDFITVKDKVIDVKTITKCCNGVPHRFSYGIYQVNAEATAFAGPRTVGNEVWGAGDKYTTFREYRWTTNFQNGRDNGRWNNYQDGALGRLRANSLSDEYQVLADDSSQSIKEFYDEVITERIGEACEDGPFGCMNSTAKNYNSSAICPDGSCECGKDESNRNMRMDLNGGCSVIQCTNPANRLINDDGSCGICNEGYHGGQYGEPCREKTTQCKLDKDWSAWSVCANGTQSRTKQKKTPTTGWKFTANSCIPIAFGALGTVSENDNEVIDTRTCTDTPPPPPADDEDEDEDTDITTQTTTVEVVEEKSMMPWIIGGAVVLGIGVYAMKK